LATSTAIREALADDPLQHASGAILVIVAESDAVTIPKIKLCEVAGQLLFLAGAGRRPSCRT
jgi:hypothetical protein